MYLSVGFAELTIGSTLFIGEAPDAPDDIVTLYQGAGVPQFTLGARDGIPFAPQFETWRLQVHVRRSGSTAYPDAQALIRQIWFALQLTNVVMGDTRYLSLDAVDNPAPLEQDKQNRISFVCNFLVMRETEAGMIP